MSRVLIFSDWSLMEGFLLTLKSQEQKTFSDRFPSDLNTWKLFPKDLDMLQGGKWLLHTHNWWKKKKKAKYVKVNIVYQPVHQNNADNKEGNCDGKKIGSWYAIRYHRCYARSFNRDVWVVTIKHQAPRKVTLPKMKHWDKFQIKFVK